jgi:uncharacterized protein YqcC (DUF446 family)
VLANKQRKSSEEKNKRRREWDQFIFMPQVPPPQNPLPHMPLPHSFGVAMLAEAAWAANVEYCVVR